MIVVGITRLLVLVMQSEILGVGLAKAWSSALSIHMCMMFTCGLAPFSVCEMKAVRFSSASVAVLPRGPVLLPR